MRKLYSRKKTYLGTITMPGWWEERLEKEGGFRFVMREPLSFQDFSTRAMTGTPLTMRTGTLIKIDYIEKGAVRLEGVTLEEWETLPDCTFSPSASYIRSLLEE